SGRHTRSTRHWSSDVCSSDLIGTRLLKNRGAGLASAILFGVSSIAFTPLHWASCLVELLVTSFSLAAFLLWLGAQERNATGLLRSEERRVGKSVELYACRELA